MEKDNNLIANISQIAGYISIGTDVLYIAGMTQFDPISLVLEITAIGTGILAHILGQDKKKANTGILLGAIGIAFRLFFRSMF